MDVSPSWQGAPLRYAWTYRAPDGTPLGAVARYDNPDGGKAVVPHFKRNGTRWLPGGADVPRPLFGLDVLSRAPADALVFAVEGEKSAAALQALGVLAVTSPGGCKGADKADWKPLSGRSRVVLCPDNDEPGEGYARDVCRALKALDAPPAVDVVRLPGLPDKGDVVDWVAARLDVFDAWDGYGPVPNADGLRAEFLALVEAEAVPPPPDWVAPAGGGWAAPVPLDMVQLPPWPVDVFPPLVADMVDGVAVAAAVPVELPALVALACLATAAQGRFRVLVKPGYSEPLALWTLAALEPGSRKSAVFAQLTAPLLEWEADARKRLEPERARRESDNATLQARIARVRAEAAKAKPQDARKLEDELHRLEGELADVPPVPRLWTDDTTPERLATLLAEHGGRMAVLSAEGGLFDTVAGLRYSGGIPNLDVLLKGHAGDSVRVDRKGQPPVFLASPAVTLGLAVQPEVLRGLATKPTFRGRGLLARVLYALPADTVGGRSLDVPPLPLDVANGWGRTLRALLDTPEAVGPDGEPGPRVLTLAPAAYGSWAEFWKATEAQLRTGGRFEHVRDWGAKLPGAVARVAALLHVARYADGQPWERPLGLEDMAAAVAMGDVLAAHALAAFDAMGADDSMDGARAVLAWVRNRRLDAFTMRDCFNALRGRFKRVAELRPALDVLAERGWLAELETERQGPGRKPSPVFEVNPAAHSAECASSA